MKRKIVKYRNKIKKLISKYPSEINDISFGNQKIIEMIDSNKPFMITRLGETELSCIVEYEKNKKKINSNNSKVVWNEKTMYKMRNNAGFFPVNSENLVKFSEFFIDCLGKSDFLGVWYNANEDKIISKYSNQAFLSELRVLEPYYNPENPWSKKLKNKKVLVIHPYVESINRQYLNKDKLFPGTEILPEFDIFVLPAVQSIAGNNDQGFKDWFEAFNYMTNKIDSIDFDIAIIGAGAYGLPLAAYIKDMGKQAIHIGGATQILFGIKGKRWDENNNISKHYNSYWVNPSSNEVPKNFHKVENGCYW